MSSARIEVEKFDGRGDYTLWKEKLLAHLEILGLSEALKDTEISEEKVSDPEETDEGDVKEKKGTFMEKARKARSTIILSVSDQVLRKIIKEKTAASMFKALDKLYMSKALPNRIYLKQKLYSFKMSDNLSIEGNIDEFLHLIADLENTNVLVSDEDQAILLLMSLPRQFDLLKDTLKYGSGRTTLSLDEVVAAIYSKELEFGSAKKVIKGQAEGLYVKEKPETRGRSEQRDKGNKNRSRSKSKSKKGCWICGEDGHFKNACPNKGKGQAKSKDQNNSKGECSTGKSNLVEANGLYVSEALHMMDIKLENEWVMDTGCSYHMTHRRDWFEELKEDAIGAVRMGNKSVSKVKGIGTVRIKNENGLTVLLKDVRFIPEMDRNLLSLGTFEKAGHKFESENGVLSVMAGNQTVLQGKRFDTLYILNGEVLTGAALVTEKKQDDTVLWHQRLGHMSQKNMDILVKRGILDKKKISTFGTCEDCIFGRAKKVGFHLAHHDSKEKLEYVHSDLWGAPSKFWAEATHTAVILINKTPSAALEFEIPDKKWFGRVPVYSYLKRFGCVAFVHTNDGKLDPRARKGVLVGYPTGVKGYKVWILEEKKLVISRNIIFQENAVYKDLVKGSECIDAEEDDQSRSFLDLDLEEERDITSGGDQSLESPQAVSPNPGTPMNLEDDDLGIEVNQTPLSYHLARDRDRRVIRAPRRFDDEDYYAEALYTTEDGFTVEPADYNEAKLDPMWENWKAAMNEEMESQLKNNTWTADLGEAKRILGMEITRDRSCGTLKLSQESYLNKILESYNMSQAKFVTTPLGAHFKLRAATEEEVATDEEFMKSVPYSNAVGSIMYA
ncbi:unnamed protein product, partial [Arabidopsis halleri]